VSQIFPEAVLKPKGWSVQFPRPASLPARSAGEKPSAITRPCGLTRMSHGSESASVTHVEAGFLSVTRPSLKGRGLASFQRSKDSLVTAAAWIPRTVTSFRRSDSFCSAKRRIA